MKPHIGIFGAGSIGSYIGGRLAAGGNRVTLIGRERFQDAINAHGMTLTHFCKPSVTLQGADYQTDPAALRDCDIIIVTVKSTGSKDAGAILSAHAKESAIIVSLQNGIGNQDVIAEAMPGFEVFAAMVPNNVVSLGDGKFHMGTEGTILMQDTAPLRSLCAAMQASGIDADVSNDMDSVQWGKLLLNLNNAINCLSGHPLKTQLMDRDHRRVLANAIEETLGVLKAAKITPAQIGRVPAQKLAKLLRLPNFLYGPIMAKTLKIDDTARSSMWEDLVQGRPTEIDFINGAVIDLAQSLDLDAPVNRNICAIVHAAFKKGRSPELTGKALRAQIQT